MKATAVSVIRSELFVSLGRLSPVPFLERIPLHYAGLSTGQGVSMPGEHCPSQVVIRPLVQGRGWDAQDKGAIKCNDSTYPPHPEASRLERAGRLWYQMCPAPLTCPVHLP